MTWLYIKSAFPAGVVAGGRGIMEHRGEVLGVGFKQMASMLWKAREEVEGRVKGEVESIISKVMEGGRERWKVE